MIVSGWTKAPSLISSFVASVSSAFAIQQEYGEAKQAGTNVLHSSGRQSLELLVEYFVGHTIRLSDELIREKRAYSTQ